MKEGWWWKFSPGQSFVLRKASFAKTAVSSLKCFEVEIYLWLTQAPNTSMEISRNKGATKKASRKMVHDKGFFQLFGKKAIFYPKMVAPPKKRYSPKSVYWYQCFIVWKMVGAKSLVHGRLANPTLSPLHRLTLLIPGDLVFIQPGVQEMSIIICAYRVAIKQFWPWPVKAIFIINTLQKTTFC